ncbi:SF-assemblin/beta giardin domain containing protein [Nitzschia inconspicua]|uniref:SF-assemblin/beta giardin domain containing protein n=1 Tax=Nitzschia inconspicua TaxID=303405 RepID=A0A9K3Q0Q8_9STRA|nr:SF-assemblin/beta giardin domain containing protein [Nitzschia inconspicua]
MAAQKLSWSGDDLGEGEEKFSSEWDDDFDDDDHNSNNNPKEVEKQSDVHGQSTVIATAVETDPATDDDNDAPERPFTQTHSVPYMSQTPPLPSRRPPRSDGKMNFGVTTKGAASAGMATPRVLLTTMNKGNNNSSTPVTISATIGTPLPDPNEENFEEIMRERNRVRKEREEHHMAALKVQISRLEDALAAETKRRVDATTALDDLARTQVFEMEQRLKQQLQEEHNGLQERLDALEDRLEALEQKWTNDSNDQIELVRNKAADLNKSLQGIQQQQDAERKARLKREGNLLEQVEQHAKEFEERWNEEQSDRIKKIRELEDQIVRHEARLAMEQKRYEERIEAELTLLKEELAEEVEERQTQDEEIVAALNRYTQQLQLSLSILSSD